MFCHCYFWCSIRSFGSIQKGLTGHQEQTRKRHLMTFQKVVQTQLGMKFKLSYPLCLWLPTLLRDWLLKGTTFWNSNSQIFWDYWAGTFLSPFFPLNFLSSSSLSLLLSRSHYRFSQNLILLIMQGLFTLPFLFLFFSLLDFNLERLLNTFESLINLKVIWSFPSGLNL